MRDGAGRRIYRLDLKALDEGRMQLNVLGFDGRKTFREVHTLLRKELRTEWPRMFGGAPH